MADSNSRCTVCGSFLNKTGTCLTCKFAGEFKGKRGPSKDKKK